MVRRTKAKLAQSPYDIVLKEVQKTRRPKDKVTLESNKVQGTYGATIKRASGSTTFITYYSKFRKPFLHKWTWSKRAREKFFRKALVYKRKAERKTVRSKK
jgi:hypothetical protein